MRLIIVLCFFVNFTAYPQSVEVLRDGNLLNIEKPIDFTVSRKTITLITDQRKIELTILKKDSVYLTKDSYGQIYRVRTEEDELGTVVYFIPQFNYLLEFRFRL